MHTRCPHLLSAGRTKKFRPNLHVRILEIPKWSMRIRSSDMMWIYITEEKKITYYTPIEPLQFSEWTFENTHTHIQTNKQNKTKMYSMKRIRKQKRQRRRLKHRENHIQCTRWMMKFTHVRFTIHQIYIIIACKILYIVQTTAIKCARESACALAIYTKNTQWECCALFQALRRK